MVVPETSSSTTLERPDSKVCINCQEMLSNGERVSKSSFGVVGSDVVKVDSASLLCLKLW